MEEMKQRLIDHIQEEAEDYELYDEMAKWYEEHGCQDKACILYAMAQDEWQHHQMLMEMTH